MLEFRLNSDLELNSPDLMSIAGGFDAWAAAGKPGVDPPQIPDQRALIGVPQTP